MTIVAFLGIVLTSDTIQSWLWLSTIQSWLSAVPVLAHFIPSDLGQWHPTLPAFGGREEGPKEVR